MSDVINMVQELRCLDGNDTVEVTTTEGQVVLSKSGIVGERGVVLDLRTKTIKLVDPGVYPALEYNPKARSLDLVIYAPTRAQLLGSSAIERLRLGLLAKQQVNDEFLDAIFCANERIRSWLER